MEKTYTTLLIFLLIFSILSTTLILAKDDKGNDDKEIKNPFSNILNKLAEIKDVLTDMLVQLKIIADKNETIIVQPTEVKVEPNITVTPPEVIIESRNEMPKRGRINVYETNRKSYPTYIVLPLGKCNVTINGNGYAIWEGSPRTALFVSESKDIFNFRNEQNCGSPDSKCSITINLDEEYYMLKLKPCEGLTCVRTPDWLDITYNCY